MISFFMYNLSILLGSFTVCIYCFFPPLSFLAKKKKGEGQRDKELVNKEDY